MSADASSRTSMSSASRPVTSASTLGDLVAQPCEPVAEVALRGVALGHGLGREHRVGLHDPGPAGVLGDRVEHVPEERRPLGLRATGHAGGLFAVAILQHRDQQRLLAAEVVQHAGVGHAGLLGDLDETALVVAALAEHAHRRAQHRLTAVLACPRAGLRTRSAADGGVRVWGCPMSSGSLASTHDLCSQTY